MTRLIPQRFIQTLIAWAHFTLNFWTGCRKVSVECKSCYVDTDMSKKKRNFTVVRRTSDDIWREAYKLNQAAARLGMCALVFTCSYSDFFHDAADLWRQKAWEVIRDCRNLKWQILTKRPERILQCLPDDWGEGYNNVWLGVSVGVRESYWRLDELRKISCHLRFISAEPLMQSLADIDLTGFSWVLVGGMSGETWETDKMDLQWAAELYDRCQQSSVAYFFKQCSSYRSERGIDGLGRYLNRIENGKYALYREIPHTSIPMVPLDTEKGHRFTDKQWQRYQTAPPTNNTSSDNWRPVQLR